MRKVLEKYRVTVEKIEARVFFETNLPRIRASPDFMENWNTNSTTSDPIQFFTARIYRKYESIHPPPPLVFHSYRRHTCFSFSFFFFRSVRKPPAKYELSLRESAILITPLLLLFPLSPLFFPFPFYSSAPRHFNRDHAASDLTSRLMHSPFKFLSSPLLLHFLPDR